jgi:VanZ family protein
MEKIIAKLNAFLSQFCIVCKVPCDKQMHFICGFIIAAVLTPFIGWYSVVLVSMIATAKEIYDDVNKDTHTADVWDLLVTIVGGVVGYTLISYII